MIGIIRIARPWITIPVTLVTVGALVLFAGAVMADQPGDLHCPSGWIDKDETGADDNDLVPDAGLLICVKAGSPSSNEPGAGSTGVIETDGTSTLQEYLFAAGIVDGSGTQGRDVSYWVTYGTPPQSAEPSTSVAASVEASVPASVAASVEASVEASAAASVPASVPASGSASPTGGELPGNPSPTGGTLPSTSVPAPIPDAVAIGLALMFLGSTAGAVGNILRRRA